MQTNTTGYIAVSEYNTVCSKLIEASYCYTCPVSGNSPHVYIIMVWLLHKLVCLDVCVCVFIDKVICAALYNLRLHSFLSVVIADSEVAVIFVFVSASSFCATLLSTNILYRLAWSGVKRQQIT